MSKENSIFIQRMLKANIDNSVHNPIFLDMQVKKKTDNDSNFNKNYLITINTRQLMMLRLELVDYGVNILLFLMV